MAFGCVTGLLSTRVMHLRSKSSCQIDEVARQIRSNTSSRRIIFRSFTAQYTGNRSASSHYCLELFGVAYLLT